MVNIQGDFFSGLSQGGLCVSTTVVGPY